MELSTALTLSFIAQNVTSIIKSLWRNWHLMNNSICSIDAFYLSTAFHFFFRKKKVNLMGVISHGIGFMAQEIDKDIDMLL